MVATGTRRVGTVHRATPVYTLDHAPQVVPIAVVRLSRRDGPPVPELERPHAHDVLVIAYFERPGGVARVGTAEWPIAAGDVVVIAPGDVVAVRGEPHEDGHGTALPDAEGWAVVFPSEALGGPDAGSFLGWESHPLLFPFVRGTGTGARHLNVPPPSRPAWVARIAALSAELADRDDGHREAARAHLTLLLIDLARLARHAGPARALARDDLLAAVFTAVEERFAGPLTTADVAATVGLTAEHLTTVVRRRTGRTVGQWIAQRRLAEARRLLTQTDLPVTRVAHLAGYPDPAYFTRVFRRAHHVPPARWRADVTGA